MSVTSRYPPLVLQQVLPSAGLSYVDPHRRPQAWCRFPKSTQGLAPSSRHLAYVPKAARAGDELTGFGLVPVLHQQPRY